MQAGRNLPWGPAVGALGEISACTEPLACLEAPGTVWPSACQDRLDRLDRLAR